MTGWSARPLNEIGDRLPPKAHDLRWSSLLVSLLRSGEAAKARALLDEITPAPVAARLAMDEAN